MLIGMHGADLLHGLFMHAGATVVEVRGFAWEDDGGVWPGWFARLFGLGARTILHYALQALEAYCAVGCLDSPPWELRFLVLRCY